MCATIDLQEGLSIGIKIV